MKMKLLSVLRPLASSAAGCAFLSRSSSKAFSPALLPQTSRFRDHQLRSMASNDSNKSADASKGQFDAEASKIYKIISENHRHPSGPWVTMLDQVHNYADNILQRKDIRVLDLATGPGEPAETIARQFPDATVIATDVSPDQIAIAEQTTLTLPHMTAQVADMADLHQFDNDTFDVVTCCYGFMFASDIPRAVRESYRVLKPGGRLIATTWNKVTMLEKARAIMERVLGELPPPPPINPLTLKEPGLFESMLTDAGYSNVETAAHEYPMDLTKDPEHQFQAATMIIKASLDEIDGGWEKARLAYDAVKYDHGEYNDQGHWILPGNEYKLTVATKKLA